MPGVLIDFEIFQYQFAPDYTRARMHARARAYERACTYARKVFAERLTGMAATSLDFFP